MTTPAVIRVSTTTTTVRATTAAGEIIRVTTLTPSVRVSNLGLQGPAGSRLVEIVVSFSGAVPPSTTFTVYLASAPVTAIPADVVAIAQVGNTGGSTVITVKLNGVTTIGTVTFATAATVGTCAFNAFSMVKGDYLTLTTTGTVASLADMMITIPVNR